MRKSMLHVRPHIIIELTRESLSVAATLAHQFSYVLRALPDLGPCDIGFSFHGESANFLIDPCDGEQCRHVATPAAAG
jgi:hypothetical protein